MQPEILILDEPTSVLDPIAAADFLNSLWRINSELGTTVIIAEHRTENIFENNLPWIKKGKILIEYGKPIYPEELDKETKKHLGVYVRGIIEEMYEENRKKIS